MYRFWQNSLLLLLSVMSVVWLSIFGVCVRAIAAIPRAAIIVVIKSSCKN